ncbi:MULTISPECIES: winged helix-turn-helix transcriptional regulator [Clostridium]|uniref:winged helix-turn-helix transcriptional regulator n=1 Tax=Clostridium TaxID=1485 RepID=UPI00098CEDF3|nr:MULTISPECIES: helix-turn-helix domain-containing protein [Clostridium]NRT76041.1 DNA-binding HxlR family transcriptional regulator [Clostridium beijerinckii]OOM35996.1 putative HTH-type transcriptional regulator YybR [Clostridium beijerinckii]
MTDQQGNKIIYYKDECHIIDALEIIGGKWRLPILFVIYRTKSIRYNELKRNIPGITNIMLTRSLQSLEEHGLVKRKEFNKIPPHVEYSLTDICKYLEPAYEVLNELGKKMSEQHSDKI